MQRSGALTGFLENEMGNRWRDEIQWVQNTNALKGVEHAMMQTKGSESWKGYETSLQ
jgi:hypothetical protein